MLPACDGTADNKSAPADAAPGGIDGSGSGNEGAPAAPAGSASFTSSDLGGRWGAPTERCGYSTTYNADGTFQDHLFDGSVGASGRWALEGDSITLSYSDGRPATERIVEWRGDTHVYLIGDPPVPMRRRRCPPL